VKTPVVILVLIGGFALVPVASPSGGGDVQTAKSIRVGQPAVYDNRSLELMLQAAEQQLAAIQLVNGSSIASKVGALQGGSSQQTAFSIQAQGPPTLAVTGKQIATTGGSGPTTSNEVDTTKSSVSPSIPSLPASTAPALPTSFSTSGLDTLNEEMQLTNEVTSLRLLLQGALNDRFTSSASKQGQQPKHVVTVGFPIWVGAPKQSLYNNTLAEVIVTVTTDPNAAQKEPPRLMTILPAERTLNDAIITDKSSGFGLGVVTQVFSVGVAGSKHNQTYRIVQDYDTVAFVGETSPCDDSPGSCSTTFGWQFRPTLGRKRVVPSLRQVFVQLSLPGQECPTGQDCKPLGDLKISARWREFDPSTGATGKPTLVKQSESSKDQDGDGIYSNGAEFLPVIVPQADIPNFSLVPPVQGILWSDAGNGQVAVEADGSFLAGTSVSIGGVSYAAGSPGFIFNDQAIRFSAPASLLFQGEASLVSPDGDQKVLEKVISGEPPSLSITKADARKVSSAEYNVEIRYTGAYRGKAPKLEPLVMIGGVVFGLSDHPINLDDPACLQAGACTLTFRAPIALLLSARSVTVNQPFFGPHAQSSHSLNILDELAPTTLTVLATTADCTMYAIQGSGFDDNVSVFVSGQSVGARKSTTCDFTHIPAPKTQPKSPLARTTNPSASTSSQCDVAQAYSDASLGPTTLLVAIPNCMATGLKAIEVHKGKAPQSVESFVLPIQVVQAAKPTLGDVSIRPGDKAFKLTGKNLGLIDLTGITYSGLSMPSTMADDESYITVMIPTSFPQTQGFYAISLKLTDGKTTVGSLVQVVNPNAQTP
jgi:hypothetical protein